MSRILLYNEAFQNSVWTSRRFRRFVAGRTIFDGTEPLADISESHRWKRRSHGLRSTADLLIILYALDTDMRLALFVEHRFAGATWNHHRPRPVELRGIRCNAMQTLVIAPRRLLRKHGPDSACYDIRLPYEEFSSFVPLFCEEIDEMESALLNRRVDFPDGGLI